MLKVSILLMLAVSICLGQTISGTIIGSVADPSGLAVAGANVTLTHTATGVSRKVQSSSSGDFVFNSVVPGVYSLTVEAPGFKKVERTSVNLTASERLSAGTIGLEVGNVAETVTVAEQGSTVQVASAERSGLLTSNQMEKLMIKGRNVTT